MGRPGYKYLPLTLNEGINEDENLAKPNQLAEAVNVWAPQGRLEVRPGTLGAGGYTAFVEDSSEIVRAIREDIAGGVSTFTPPVGFALNIGDMTDGEKIYIGWPSYKFNGIEIGVNPANLAATWATCEYWNGSRWKPLTFIESTWDMVLAADGPYDRRENVNTRFLGVSSSVNVITKFQFAAPADWTTKIVQGYADAAYYIRFTIKGVSITTGAILQILGGKLAPLNNSNTVSRNIYGIFPVQYAKNKQYVAVRNSLVNAPTGLFSDHTYFSKANSVYGGLERLGRSVVSNVIDLPSIAIVPQYGETYVAYGYIVGKLSDNVDPLVINATLSTSNEISLPAEVETDPLIVGAGGSYDSTDIPQLGSFPSVKFITYFQGQLWTANEETARYRVRWSAPSPYHRVWPQINYEDLMEDDNSEITGLRGYQQNILVFKNDSIWQMVYTGEVNGLATYSPQRIVAGVGCASNSSIAEVRGRLVFLGDEGIFAFDGTPNTSNLILDPETGANRLKKTWSRISPSKRAQAVGVFWKKYSCYLLAVTLDGSVNNNAVLVLDVNKNSWWLWEDINVQSWLLTENAADNEQLSFVDSFGLVHNFVNSPLDNYASISTAITTQPLLDDSITKRLRVIEVDSTNLSQAATLEVLPDNIRPGITTASAENRIATLDFTDDAESAYIVERDRRRSAYFLQQGKKFAVRLTHETTGSGISNTAPFQLNSVSLGYVVTGKR